MLTGVLAVLASGLLLCSITVPALAATWGLGSLVLWALVCWQLQLRLHLNRPDLDSPLYPDLGWANRMTIARGWLICAVGGFLLVPTLLWDHTALAWLVAALYSLAAILDRLDGFVARRSRRSSLLGGELDTVFDALGLVVAPLLALALERIHVSYLLVSVAYYLFVLGIKARERRQLPVYPLAPSQLRRTLAGFQMGYVAVILWPPFDAEVSRLAGWGFMLPLLLGFVLDWLVVSGRIDPGHGSIARGLQRLRQYSHDWLLPALRLLMLPCFALMFPALAASPVAGVLAGLAALSIAGGVGGRLGALTWLLLMAWLAPLPVEHPLLWFTLFACIAVLLLGGGRFSLWQADDDWVSRHDGA